MVRMIKNHIKTIILLGVLTAILIWVGRLLGGMNGMYIALFLSLAMNIGSYWYSDRLVLRMYNAQPANPQEYKELHTIVEEVSKEANIPKPRVYVLPIQQANAFATGRNPQHAAVACTKGIMELLSKEELKGVIAHELSHIKNRDTLIATVAATIAGVISWLAYTARFAAMFGGSRDDRGGNGIELLALAILTPIVAMIVQLAISRSREYLADETGAKLIKNSKPLASALAKLHNNASRHPLNFGTKTTSSLFIVNPFSAKGLTGLFSTHPRVEERIKRLEKIEF